MLHKRTEKTVTFLLVLFLVMTFGCSNHTSVDSLNDEKEVVELQHEGRMDDLQLNRSYYETGPITSMNVLQNEMKKMIESHEIDINQSPKFSISENTLWSAGESSFNIIKKEDETGLLYIIDPCFEEYYGDDLDCEGYPPPPPASPAPVPPINIYAVHTSFINVSAHTGMVQMGSWSATTQPIDFMGVIGTSYRDYLLLGGYSNGGSNRDFAGVVLTASKPGFPFSDEVRWEQYGQHYFEHNGGSVVLYSNKTTNF